MGARTLHRYGRLSPPVWTKCTASPLGASTTDTPTLPGGISSLISAQIGPSGIAARASRTSRIESSNSATRTSTRAHVSPASCVAI